jgi:ATP-binding protein involved in chromosome partitioning
MSISKAQIEAVLSEIIDENMETNLVDAGSVKELLVDANNVSLTLVLGYPAAGYFRTLKKDVQDKLATIEGIGDIDINISSAIKSHAVQQNLKPLPGIKNIIAVASGKGGVGKSTTAVNLALALHMEGATVGILDADIYGPSIPRMLGCSGQPESSDGKSLEPMIGHGIQSMSIGYLVEEDSPMIWRGPMVTQALEQLLNDTRWSEVDYLIIDLPPGTGDTQLTLAQKIPVSGAVIVTTPQDIALLDARKGLKMFEKVEVPVWVSLKT